MLKYLKRIQNPIGRGVAAGVTVASIIVINGAVGLAFSGGKNEPVFRKVLQAAAIGGGIAAIAGAFVSPTKPTAKKSQPQIDNFLDDQGDWKNWRPFVVRRKVKESEDITSFYLEPEDGGPLPGFKPGQFLTIQLNIPGQKRPVIRSYSLSDYAETPQYYRLSIKREPAPKDQNVPPGLGSGFMHDQVHEGGIISVKPPNGKFFLDLDKAGPAILISNGVGITPMISMAKACQLRGGKRPVWFLHGARNGQFHALREEVNSLGVNVHYRYSRPRPEDEGHYQSTGYINAELIQSEILPTLGQQRGLSPKDRGLPVSTDASAEAEYFLHGSPSFRNGIRSLLRDAEHIQTHVLPTIQEHNSPSSSAADAPSTDAVDTTTVADAEYFLCGSIPFMDSLRAGLRDMGVLDENVHFEAFGPGPKKAKPQKSEELEEEEATVATSEVVFSESGKTLTWTPDDGTLLEFAEANDIDPPSSCLAGVCMTCMCPIQEGEVSYEDEPAGTPDEGTVLLCVAKPRTQRVVLDL